MSLSFLNTQLTVGLWVYMAEWIIDDTYLVSVFLSFSYQNDIFLPSHEIILSEIIWDFNAYVKLSNKSIEIACSLLTPEKSESCNYNLDYQLA